MIRFTRRRLVMAGGTAILGTAAAVALLRSGPDALAPARVFAVDGLAIRGTDPVAYFREGRPVPGLEEFETVWAGAHWRFASAGARDAFRADPLAFAPQYGGFCAWAVAVKGELYSTQPANWRIVDGRLFLNFNDDVQRRWEADIPGFIAEADARWPAIAARA